MSQSNELGRAPASAPAGSQPAGSDPQASPPPAGNPQPGLWTRLRPYVLPVVDTVWLNVRVWLPMLATPQFRACQLNYTAREGRDGKKWDIALPKQCWQCASRDRLMQREYEQPLRGFESPIAILVCTGSIAVLLLLLAIWMRSGTCFMLAMFTLLGGGAFMFVKSWSEHVRLLIFTCPDHADQLRSPLMVAYDNGLYMILPTEGLMQKAREELALKRRSDQRYSERSDTPPEITTPGQGRLAPESYRRDELPPIKLDE
ncbi:MAG TPA: hypothetical protein VIK18_13860 [Pirellulales bacterium]